jgi:hypothetical protein
MGTLGNTQLMIEAKHERPPRLPGRLAYVRGVSCGDYCLFHPRHVLRPAAHAFNLALHASLGGKDVGHSLGNVHPSFVVTVHVQVLCAVVYASACRFVRTPPATQIFTMVPVLYLGQLRRLCVCVCVFFFFFLGRKEG